MSSLNHNVTGEARKKLVRAVSDILGEDAVYLGAPSFSWLVKQMTEQEGIAEQLKVDSQMEWVGCMNNIKERAIEVISTERRLRPQRPHHPGAAGGGALAVRRQSRRRRGGGLYRHGRDQPLCTGGRALGRGERHPHGYADGRLNPQGRPPAAMRPRC